MIVDVHIVHKVTAKMPVYKPIMGKLKTVFRKRRRPNYAVRLAGSVG